MSKTLIKGGCVLTLGERTPNYRVADVLIEDGRIVEVGPGTRSRGAEVIDASDTIVMPGFVDGHRHAWRSLFRSAGDQGSGDVMEHLDPDAVYAGTLISLLAAATAGITTVVDWAYTPSPEFLDATLEAHRESRLRTVLVTPLEGAEQPSSRTSFAYPGAAESAQTGIQTGRDSGRRVHIKMGERSDVGIASKLADQGLLGEDVTVIHGTSLDGSDFDALSRSRTGLVVTPSVEMAGGLGMPPLQEIIDRSIRPGLGVGDESLGPGDIFAQMRSANSVQHARLFDLKLAGKGGIPNLLSTRDVIRYATGWGASAVGLGSMTGSVEPGKQADLVVLRTDLPNIAPINDPIGAVVWGMDASNVDWVFVAGEPVVIAGSVKGADRAKELASSAAIRVAEVAGMPATSEQGAP